MRRLARLGLVFQQNMPAKRKVFFLKLDEQQDVFQFTSDASN
jgi:hypothetical protein